MQAGNFDIAVFETTNGGDILKKGNDLATIGGWENMPYLALFGHRGGITKNSYAVNEFRTDWWANALLHPQQPAAQINSRTEDALHTTPLTSAGLLVIEEAMKEDLRFMQPFAQVTVSAAIIGPDHLQLSIRVVQPDNLQQKDFIFLWDATKGELLQPDSIYQPNNNPLLDEALQYQLGFYL